MSKNYLIRLLLFTISILILNNDYYSQNVSKTGTTSANFLEIGVGGYSFGMGGAFVSISDDASALYWNAGGIANLNKNEAIIVHTDWIAETSYDFAGLVIPLNDFGTIGISFQSLSMDDMKVRTIELPEGTGEFFSSSDISIGLSYARKLTERFSIGFSAKYIEQKIWHMKANAFAIDAGTLFKTDLFGGMIIGASISNFGTAMQLSGSDARYYIRVDETKLGSNANIPTSIEMDSWDLPLLMRIGVSTNVIEKENYKFKVAADAVVPNNNYQSLNVGGEFSFIDLIKFRAGYNSLFLEDAEGGFSLGVGVDSNMLLSVATVSFDYGYRDFGRLNNIHTFSLNLKF
ncbi:MAG: PorV/PorQ family protein [Melioribacteraceae bacterium]|nr:PorV/PorQ family protein [Melioribacteraceae bacterium]